MTAHNIIPEFECFDTGIVRSVGMFKANGMFEGDPHISFVMGVDSGMPARPDLLPILKDELPDNPHWQVIATGPGRENNWKLHEKCVELGGNVRTGLEDIFFPVCRTDEHSRFCCQQKAGQTGHAVVGHGGTLF